MSDDDHDRFHAELRLRLDPGEVWRRLTGDGEVGAGDHLWLPGFDSQATVAEAEPPSRLRVTKDDEPCAGTDIVVTLEHDPTGTVVRVVQSRFGDWLAQHPDAREAMAIGWRFIVADLQTFLATGAHARRHLRSWGDLGAAATAADGGVRVTAVRPDGLAARLGIRDGDLLVGLAGAPVASLDDLVTVLRVLGSGGEGVDQVELIRDGMFVR